MRRSFTTKRAATLLFLILSLGLLNQTNFIENPFSPFFAFAGIGFVAFGIAWDALTAGSWANVDSSRLPRTARIFLYVGYTLLTVTIINWALASHNLTEINRYTGGLAILGLDIFGVPYLYALFFTMLNSPDYPSLSEAAEF